MRWTEVRDWRRLQRQRLQAARVNVTSDSRRETTDRLVSNLRAVVDARVKAGASCTLSGYWPIKGEIDLRPVLQEFHEAGNCIALPVVEVVAAPLIFRRWTPGMKLERGFWNIPVPPTTADVLRPQIILAPLVGWDKACYRLGYGGGYFDRTLASLEPQPFKIGVGSQMGLLETIHPQPHDIPLDVIVTEAGVQAERGAP